LPDKAVRQRMLDKWAADATEAVRQDMAEKTDGMSGAHIFELAHFAKTIRDEDECDLDTALVKALEKVNEQRELITAGQLAGSSYRPGRRATMTLVKTADGSASIDTNASQGSGAPDTKGGRVLSQRNYDKLQGVHDDLAEIAKMEDCPRPAKALAKSAMAAVKEIMAEATPPQEEPEQKAAAHVTDLDAFRILLASKNPELIARAHKALGAFIEVARKDAKAEAYRKTITRNPTRR
jgi:hypothetical protein